MKQYRVQTPDLVKGKQRKFGDGMKFGKWITRFKVTSLEEAITLGERIQDSRPYRILYGKKRVD